MSRGRTLLTTGALLVAFALFLFVNMIAHATLGGARVDLTSDGLYSLSPGSRNLAAGLVEPVTLKLYFSSRQAADIPTLKTYADRVQGLLQEFATSSGGKLQLQVVDPEPFSETEDEAVAAGLQGAMLPSGESIYFGLVATGSTDERSVVPFLDPQRETSLEYDVARMIYKLGRPDRPVVALITALPLEGEAALPFPGGTPEQPPWFVTEQLKEVFDVRPVELTARSLPPDTDLLLVVHPKGISDATQYAIDQYVLGGGHALIFVDPYCERDVPPRDPTNPMAQFQAVRSSNLDRLFRAWGLQVTPDQVVGDRNLAVRVQSGSRAQPKEVDYILWLGLGREQVDADDVVTADLGKMILATAGAIEPLEGATTELQPLLRTTDQAMLVDQAKIQFMPDPERLLAEYVPGGRVLTLAARVRGPAQTAFPEGRPKPPTQEPEEAAAETLAEAPGLTESTQPIEVLVVADADLLGDDLWVQMQNFFGQRVALPIASNGDFVVHALDNLSGNNDLISLRNRASFDRPFERIEAIRKEAEQRLLAREQQLQDELSQTERRLSELQSKKDDKSSMILSPEQRAEIERFQEQRVATRKELREVRHDLNKDIDRMQTWIKAFNIGVVPLLVGALAVGLGLRSGRRRSR
jgi:ABC-type uncharacterized transport system involved in gliding motility auxiliary subunit